MEQHYKEVDLFDPKTYEDLLKKGINDSNTVFNYKDIVLEKSEKEKIKFCWDPVVNKEYKNSLRRLLPFFESKDLKKMAE